MYWCKDRKGIPRVKQRTARKKLRRASKRIKKWIKENRYLPNSEFIEGLNRREGKRRSFTWATFLKAVRQLGVIGPRIEEQHPRYLVYA